MAKGLATVLALVLPHFRVDLEVPDEARAPDEGLATLIALIWPLPRVDPLVPNEQ